MDGDWADFGNWSECSVPCGGGTVTRTRTCTNPSPAYGGADCVGEKNETRTCNENKCPGLNHITSQIYCILFTQDYSNNIIITRISGIC